MTAARWPARSGRLPFAGVIELSSTAANTIAAMAPSELNIFNVALPDVRRFPHRVIDLDTRPTGMFPRTDCSSAAPARLEAECLETLHCITEPSARFHYWRAAGR